jgi:hypothetical protein
MWEIICIAIPVVACANLWHERSQVIAHAKDLERDLDSALCAAEKNDETTLARLGGRRNAREKFGPRL